MLWQYGRSITLKDLIIKLILNELKKIKTLIVVEHDMGFVRRIADVVTVMHMGSLLAKGSIEQIEKNQEVRNVYLGTEDE